MVIGLLGFGTVGGGVYEMLRDRMCMDVKYVLCLENPDGLAGKLVRSVDQILSDDTVDTVVEVMGGLHPAREFVLQAMAAGKNVVTANKLLLAECYEELTKAAAQNHVALRCTAAVGGGIGWLTALERCKRTERVHELTGIMNGTTNYILDTMQTRGVSFADALHQAQELGYAERDPAADIDGEDILKMTPDERAKAGIFLAMQYPVEVPGVSMTNFLRTAKTEVDGKAPAIRTWTKELSEAMKRLKMDPKFATRSVNEGFSGGEKKRAEVLQLELLKPKFAILDETDSGLDVDALRIVSEGVNRAKEVNQFGILMVTHYTRILRYIKPDIVHVFADGHFIKTGGPELADELEETGYDAYLPEGSDSESALA